MKEGEGMIRNRDFTRTRWQGFLMFFGVSWLILVTFPAEAEDGNPEEEAGWKGSLSASVTAQSGSVDTFAGAVDAGVERDRVKNKLSIRFTGVYGTTRDRNGPRSKNKAIQNSQALYGGWKHIIHERFFWNSIAELSRDSTQDREVRTLFRTGPGYRVWQGEDSDAIHFDMSGAIGYRYELYDGNNDLIPAVQVQGSDQQLVDVVAGFEYKNLLFDGHVEWTHTGSVAVPANQTSAYIVRTEGIASIPLTEVWSFRAGIYYEYVNNVPSDVNPSKLRATMGLGYEF